MNININGILRTTENGYVVEEWRENGLLHREDGPAFRRWKMVQDENDEYDDDQLFLISEEYYHKGLLHRIEGPAAQKWELRGGVSKLTYQSWNLGGKITHQLSY